MSEQVMFQSRMKKGVIEGVTVRDLVVHADDHGYLYEILKEDWPEFERFGQLYLTVCYPGIVKGWHYHEYQSDHFCVIKGMAKVVLYDDRPGSPTRHELMEVTMGEYCQKLVVFPIHVMHGVVALNNEPAWLLNIPNVKYNPENPDEMRIPYDTPIQRTDGTVRPYSWFRPFEDEEQG